MARTFGVVASRVRQLEWIADVNLGDVVSRLLSRANVTGAHARGCLPGLHFAGHIPPYREALARARDKSTRPQNGICDGCWKWNILYLYHHYNIPQLLHSSICQKQYHRNIMAPRPGNKSIRKYTSIDNTTGMASMNKSHGTNMLNLKRRTASIQARRLYIPNILSTKNKQRHYQKNMTPRNKQ